MALLQIAEPGLCADPHQHRLAIGIDLGTTNSLVATVRSGSTTVLEDETGRALLPSVVRYVQDGSPEVGLEAQLRQSDDPAQHHRLGQTLHGTRPEGRAGCGRDALPLRRRPRHGAPGNARRREKPGGSLGGNPQGPARPRRSSPRRRTHRRGDHRAGLLRRRPAPGNQGCRAPGRHQRAAPAERTDRGGHRVWPGQRIAGHLLHLRSGRRHLRYFHPAPQPGHLRSGRHQRRFRAGRRRFRRTHLSLDRRAGRHRRTSPPATRGCC